MIRAVNVASDAGIFAILVHALSEQARRFYMSRGFVESPLQPMTLMMTLETIRSILTEKSKTGFLSSQRALLAMTVFCNKAVL